MSHQVYVYLVTHPLTLACSLILIFPHLINRIILPNHIYKKAIFSSSLSNLTTMSIEWSRNCWSKTKIRKNLSLLREKRICTTQERNSFFRHWLGFTRCFGLSNGSSEKRINDFLENPKIEESLNLIFNNFNFPLIFKPTQISH